MAHRRWLQIKTVKKSCNKNTVDPKFHDDYDPTYKYDYIYKKIIHNIKFLSKHTELDQTGDKTSWETASPGEKGAGVTFRVKGNTEVTNGCQPVLVCEGHLVFPCTNIHRHKLHMKPQGWGEMGMIEVRRMAEAIMTMVEGISVY